MTLSAIDFIRAHTTPMTLPWVPEITLHLAQEITPLWQAKEKWLGQTNTPPPFWAFAWPGGMALARYVLDHPDAVRGLRALDFAAGSGIAAIAMAKAGTAEVQAADIDPLAQVATQLNAARNGAMVETLRNLDMEKPISGVDLIVAGDVCYEQAMSHRVLRWLRLCAAAGTHVWLADPGRAYAPEEGLSELARYQVPTLRELEDRDARDVTVWKLSTS